MEPERDERYKVAYGMLKTFNENLGLWIQFKRGRDVLLAQKTVVDHFKVFLQSYRDELSAGGAMDYEQVGYILSENNWESFKSIQRELMSEGSVETKDSSPRITDYFPLISK